MTATTRRKILSAATALTGGSLLGCAGAPPSEPRTSQAPSGAGRAARATSEPSPHDAIEAIAARIGGRLGVHVYDAHSGERFGHDDEDRFAMASTFKWMLAAAVLARADSGALALADRLPFGPDDLLDYAPVAKAHVAEGGLPIGELCAAAVVVSDNTAANLLLKLLDGPAGFTQFLQGIGDTVTRLDRFEPELNTNLAGDPRDTTTPRAMVETMEKILLGDVLMPASRALLVDWLLAVRTGGRRIRAGLPADWRVGDKTGTGENMAINDVAIAWPPERAPILIALYTSGSPQGQEAVEAAHVEIAALVAQRVGRSEG